MEETRGKVTCNRKEKVLINKNNVKRLREKKEQNVLPFEAGWRETGEEFPAKNQAQTKR